ncbi:MULTISPECIES: PDR/VanB family oxidoreductase [unclassified Mesorhizobium]|uniref:PDR/VanB family oxidoreductase n=1 Tax=unclassified Mesorhizobium TaxID=325217 RepID=UPI000FD6D466|nr:MULTISPECIES: PDR/VanB family oxidoreductase [unclassified Mesorhizobium]TGR23000.1 oxidoreductase [Mesorhizobium sp. M8A.F.Ca.ET.197.01.1.1]TGR39085.1 oxidoreductase [bacterium M00.F.Ca.ET.199.01.1.1]TGR46679.1 oxidoreductase [Mesorhizobium sp. M8A.F.Ca.ET.198.01.1.1]TGV85248.1 oxidoreductase [Mesorhizobium sp. M00.F.Ca.ET.149.01.1.1]
MSPAVLLLTIECVKEEALGVRSYTLGDASGGELPSFTAGAHIDCHLDNGLLRSYSLCNNPDDRLQYAIAVARDDKGRGGSIFIQDNWRVGSQVAVSLPRNNFPLAANAAATVLVAGGIGITPMLSMIRTLEGKNAPWTLAYASRSRTHAAFRDELSTYGDRVRFHYDDEMRGVLDMAEVVARADRDAHLYCCGPAPMLAAFELQCRERAPSTVHVEYFANEQSSVGRQFEVYLRRSDLTLNVGAEQTILQAVLAAGVDAPFSCMEGTCGECVTKIVAGVADQRDRVLTRRKRAENKVMMICCSRSMTDVLTLDL